ncbi:exonuclease domain-containing protein [Alteromonas lipotrueiana]|uniref:exonuclease domain-containing protein n=1 Tax=Alteromonas lipotrueiana TaxID=2803815 RepID=UPI001C47784B|nr:exonuclease domain-containing protein [Alteromonas lipotrueiana]
MKQNFWQAWLTRFHPLVSAEKKRRYALAKNHFDPQLKTFFDHKLPHPETRLKDVECVVLDFETSGLDASMDAILSVGMVSLKFPVLSLSTAQHYYVDTGHSVVPDTAIINHIVPETLNRGMAVVKLGPLLLQALAGKVVIAHGAWIERQFLHTLLDLPEHIELPLVFLDTLAIERSMSVSSGMVKPDLRLTSIRENRGLPPYLAHNAFADAVATGELFLAQVTDIFGLQNARLGPLVKRSR